jgi:hypothetical protein
MLQKVSGKTTVLAILLTGSMLLGGAKPAQAYSYASCQQRIQKAQRKLEKAVQRHGAYSSQAARRRSQLERVSAHCH